MRGDDTSRRLRLLAISARETLLGRDSLAALAEMDAAPLRDSDAVNRYVEERKYDAALRACQTSPLYRQRFGEAGISEADLRARRGWERIPLLEKADLQERIGEVYAGGFRGRSVCVHTSGSTGRPLELDIDTRSLAYSMAAARRGQRWWGIEPGASWVWFGVTRTATSADWRVRTHAQIKALADRVCGVTFRPMYAISDEGCLDAIRTIQRSRPDAVMGWGSTLFCIADYALRNSMVERLHGPRAVFYTGDYAADWQRERISEAFGAPLVSEYGCTEAGNIAYDCPCGLAHASQDLLLVEVLGQDGVVRPFGRGETVITSLNSGKLPLIRYRLGDIIDLVQTGSPCPNGFVGKSIASLYGRNDSIIYSPSGVPVHPDVFKMLFRYLPGVRRGQVREGALGELTLLIEVLVGYSASEVATELESQAAKSLDAEFRVNVQAVERIPETPSGKICAVIGNPANRPRAFV